jgi:hypothetical protein
VWQSIKTGDVLRPGTVIQTSADDGSYVDLLLEDRKAAAPQPVTYRPSIPDSRATAGASFQPTSEQNVVRIWGDSALGIDRLIAMETGADLVTETQLDLKRGRVSGSVKKLSAASKFDIKLPNGMAEVRGTLFDIQAVGIVRVYIGSLVVAWVDPKTQKVTTQIVMGGQLYDAPSNHVSLLSTESMEEFQQLSLRLMEVQTAPSLMPVASDYTVIGMSPVGAEPGSTRSAPNRTVD